MKQTTYKNVEIIKIVEDGENIIITIPSLPGLEPGKRVTITPINS